MLQKNRLTTTLQRVALLLMSCTLFAATAHADSHKTAPQVSKLVIERFGEPPHVPTGDFSDELKQAMNTAFIESFETSKWGVDQDEAVQIIANSKDPRIVWVITDLMRFVRHRQVIDSLSNATAKLLNTRVDGVDYWGQITNKLIAWDIPAPPDYLTYKSKVFTTMIPGWDEIFVPGDIDWRHVSWGGVLIDNRPFDTTDELCNCIPAADNPEVSDVAGADWLKDSDVVFGIAINGEARAYPRRIMEVREMVNDTLGGRDLGIPYCTLCGSAQAYFTDEVPEGVERPVLRTSGLLIRSNKVMYDINSYSVFDTFLGHAVTGPLAEKGIKLAQASVLTTTWGEWKKAYPQTTVLKESLALGRDFDFRNNRDADGPIFPVGDVDPRLSVHEDIIGVISPSGEPVAFQLTQAQLALNAGEAVNAHGVSLMLDGGGIRAIDNNGKDLGSHQAFWFAWSQFQPETKLWPSQGS